MKVADAIKNIIKSYPKSAKTLFLLFLVGVLSCGRSFSVLHINTQLFPLFVTEILLFVTLPLIVMKFKLMVKLPKKFLVPLFLYFLFGCLHLAVGIFNKNLFALRDIVLCGYILFLPITLITFSEKQDMKLFLRILILCNLIGLALGRLWMLKITSSLLPTHFTSTLKTFNLGLYFGITVAFLISFFNLIKNKWHKILVVMLISLNIYILTFFKVRTIWAAGIALIVFFLLVSWRKLLNVVIPLIPIIIIIFSVLGYFDSDLLARFANQYVSVKGDVKTFLKKVITLRPGNQYIPTKGDVKTFTKKTITPTSGEVSKPALKEPVRTASGEFSFHSLPSERFGSRNNLTWRLDIWQQAIYYGLESPFIGKGFGVYPQYVVWKLVKPLPKRIDINSKVIPTHNHLVSIFYKMGFLGLGLFLFINGYVFLYGLRYIKKCNTDFVKCFLIGSLGSFVFWHTSALFFDVIDSPPTSIFLWIIMGLIFSIIEIDKRNNEH